MPNRPGFNHWLGYSMCVQIFYCSSVVCLHNFCIAVKKVPINIMIELDQLNQLLT